jgi:hypothetical protein
MRNLLLLAFFLSVSGFSQERKHITRNRKPIKGFGEFMMGTCLSDYPKLKDLTPTITKDSLFVYHVEESIGSNGVDVSDVYLKFKDEKLVEIDIEYNQILYNIFSYLQGCKYRNSEGRYNQIEFFTYSKYRMIAYIRRDSSDPSEDRMILFLPE